MIKITIEEMGEPTAENKYPSSRTIYEQTMDSIYLWAIIKAVNLKDVKKEQENAKSAGR